MEGTNLVSNLWTDKGKRFYNKQMNNLVDLHSTENEEKASIDEREPNYKT